MFRFAEMGYLYLYLYVDVMYLLGVSLLFPPYYDAQKEAIIHYSLIASKW